MCVCAYSYIYICKNVYMCHELSLLLTIAVTSNVPPNTTKKDANIPNLEYFIEIKHKHKNKYRYCKLV